MSVAERPPPARPSWTLTKSRQGRPPAWCPWAWSWQPGGRLLAGGRGRTGPSASARARERVRQQGRHLVGLEVRGRAVPGRGADHAHDPSASWCRSRCPAIRRRSSARDRLLLGDGQGHHARYRAGVFTMLQPGRVSRGLSMSLSRSLVHVVGSARVAGDRVALALGLAQRQDGHRPVVTRAASVLLPPRQGVLLQERKASLDRPPRPPVPRPPRPGASAGGSSQRAGVTSIARTPSAAIITRVNRRESIEGFLSELASVPDRAPTARRMGSSSQAGPGEGPRRTDVDSRRLVPSPIRS